MKKNILLFIIIFCCTGCHVDYRLNIDTVKKIQEDVKLSASTEVDETRFNDFNSYVPINYGADDMSAFVKKLNGVDYYNITKNDNMMRFQYKKFDVNKLNNGMFVHRCYRYVSVINQKESKELLLSTSREFLCYDMYDTLDDVTVTITSKYKLKDTNADEVNKHEYKWFINKGNADNKYLYLLLDTSVRELSFLDRLKEGEYTNSFTIFLAIFLGIGIIIFLFKKKGDRRNKV